MNEPLLLSARFLLLFVTQLPGALNDNLFKNALVVFVIFRNANGGPSLVAAAGGVFILPYVLFSAMAGQLADRYDKSRLIRITKLFEIALMLLAAIGFLTGSIGFLMAVLFGLGVQATFFGPLKYAILPDHLRADEIVAGNARIEAGTFVGILIGTIAGGLLILPASGRVMVLAAGLLVAYAIVQEWSDPQHRARMIAAANVLNAACMVAGAAILAALSAAGMGAPVILLIAALLNVGVAIAACRVLRRSPTSAGVLPLPARPRQAAE
jgi:hypothetical protein